MNDHPINIVAVTKKFREVVAVDRLSLLIQSGEVYGLIGANGAGKSTLIRMIAGLTAPDEGSILVCGALIARAPQIKRRLGYLPEELFLYEKLTGREYLQLVAGLKDADASSVERELEFFELAAVAGKLIGGYSLGMRKKVGLGAAFLGSPDALILDEPLNGLDVEMMRKLRLRIEAERAGGRTFLVSSHVMSFIERICDRVGIMRAGKLIAEGTPAELRTRAVLPDASFEDVFFHLVNERASGKLSGFC